MTSTTKESYVYVGGEKGGVARKRFGEGDWELLTNGLPDAPVVIQISVNPKRPEVVFVGTRDGAYRSVDNGTSWEKVNLPESGLEVWSFAFHPEDPDLVYVGAAPPRIFRSKDGGNSWETLPIVVDSNAECDLGFPTRIIAMSVNPGKPEEIYAGMEVAGMIRSLDGGDSWEIINEGLAPDENRVDIHGVGMTSAKPDTVFMITRLGPWLGKDRGNEWEFVDLKPFSPITHTRDFKVDPHNPNVFYVGVGASVFGEDGAVMRSKDLGRVWERVDKGVKPNSTVRSVSLSIQQPSVIYCCTRYGQVFGTHDGGDIWQTHPLPESVTELRAVAVS